MSRVTILFKVLSTILALALISLTIINVKTDVWRVEALPSTLYQTGVLIRYGFSLINYYSTISFINMMSLLTASFNSDLSQALTQLSTSYYNFIWGAQPVTPPSLISVLMSLYYLSFQILLAAVIVSLILFVFRTRLKYVFTIFLGLNSIIVLAALLGNELIGLTPLSGHPLIFITNPIFFLIILSYYYLEVSFTSLRVNELFKENIKLKEEVLKKIIETKTDQANNISDLSSRDKLGKIDVFKLSAFIEKLEVERKDFKELISGASLISDGRKMIGDFIIKSLLRASFIILMVFICVNPFSILSLIGSRALVESVEFITPEITILLLLPLSLFFPMISLIIDYRKRQRKR
ncbi:MAG: hypothetical protein OdinLCB4_005690 [Candidatus Odinarchaeum yellowstonii]|uniref:Uncharacterized protein n=1 Tax=Odinarchaeota yellowstonii (strain LCB_4) TaxID=1841599 RepID=A0AAF0D1J6_ODILC|nr:MAG: hypothetical protein OdinLCB4_005690 [Candidatus Odinarchaeum yellowstonii]